MENVPEKWYALIAYKIEEGGNTVELTTIEQNGAKAAIIQSGEPLITDVSSALDLMATVKYETGCDRFAINKAGVAEDFFRLSTCLAGEILQKFVNYHVKFAVYGDFSNYTSKPLHDFIYESNHGKDIFFAANAEEAARVLCAAKE